MSSGRIEYEIPKDVIESCVNFLKTENNRYIIVGGELQTEKLKVLKTAPKSASFSDLLKELPDDDCRFVYAIVGNEVIFIHWVPPAATGKKTSMLLLAKDDFVSKTHAPEVEIIAKKKEDLSDAKVKEALEQPRVEF